MNFKRGIAFFSIFIFSSIAQASSIPSKGFYVSGQVGVAQRNFNHVYSDLTSTVAQNATAEITQRGYTAGLAVGYSRLMNSLYLLGAEIAGNVTSNNASYSNGSTGFIFSDKTKINSNVDLVFVPGLLLTDSITSYLRLGISFASVKDQLTSPVGFIPITDITVSSTRSVQGFVAGLGFKKYFSNNVNIFAEYDYYDYGNTNFSGFTNFTADYSHSAHIYASKAVVGLGYSFA